MQATGPVPASGRDSAGLRRGQRRVPPALGWGLTLLVLLAVSLLIVLSAGTRPGYDPYGWLVWGKLTVHWQLDTNGAPSWKPLPVLFTVPYALAGHDALWLWMITAVAVSLSGVVFAWRLAFRLTGGRAHPYAATAAGAVACILLLGIRDYSHYILSAQSDTMIVSLCLAAVDCQLNGRRRWALWLWVLAALGRPEAWPVLGLYALWLWRAEPGLRADVVGGLVLIPLLWFGVPALTANSWFVAGQNALHSPRELHQSKVMGTIDRYFDLHETTVWIAALLAVVLGAGRRERVVLALAGGSLGWLVIEIAFVLHGWPGVPRYLFEPVGVACVLAAVGVGRLFVECSRAATALGGGHRVLRLGAIAATLASVALALPLVSAARSRWTVESRDLTHEHDRTAAFNRLAIVVHRLGAGRMLACAVPHIPIGYQSVLAWYLGIGIGALYVNADEQRLHPTALLNLYPIKNGWKVFPSHIPPAGADRCRGLQLIYRSSPSA